MRSETNGAAKPVPAITEEMRPFYAAAARGELVVQRCGGCGVLRFPARPLCTACLSTDSTWVPVCGRGEVFSFIVMHQVYHPGFANEVPYAVVIVQLAEGPRMVSNLVGVAPHAIRIGMPVRVVFEQVSEAVTLPKFAPAE
jgi:uncharacterized OB-fold protein